MLRHVHIILISSSRVRRGEKNGSQSPNELRNGKLCQQFIFSHYQGPGRSPEDETEERRRILVCKSLGRWQSCITASIHLLMSDDDAGVAIKDFQLFFSSSASRIIYITISTTPSSKSFDGRQKRRKPSRGREATEITEVERSGCC